jgi:succinate-acetate transporter protein
MNIQQSDSTQTSNQPMKLMVVETARVVVEDPTANQAPLGLLAFGLTTVLLNLHNAGFFGLDAMILSMGIFYGGAAQVIAGIMEWRKGNTFATTAFLSYGFFWFTLAGLLIFPKAGLGTAPGPEAMAAYLAIWGAFTAVMFIGTLRLNRALQTVFLSLAVLFFLLAIGDITGLGWITTVAGYEGIFCGASAIYTGLAQVMNEVYGRTVAPLGVMA